MSVCALDDVEHELWLTVQAARERGRLTMTDMDALTTLVRAWRGEMRRHQEAWRDIEAMLTEVLPDTRT